MSAAASALLASALPPARLAVNLKLDRDLVAPKDPNDCWADIVAPDPTQVRLIESGKFVQRVELLGLGFVDATGQRRTDLAGSLGRGATFPRVVERLFASHLAWR